MEKVFVGMSGGVDSSVAAYLLKKQGYEVVGVTMLMFHPDNEEQRKCTDKMIEDAKKVAEQLHIEHIVIDMSEIFHDKIMKNFKDEYLRGRTPNPCVLCNRYVKWERLLSVAREYGATYIATGHYAKIMKLNNQRYVLHAAASDLKDQTYALYQLTQDQLAHTLFPLGELEKDEVRKIAGDAGLCVAQKSDSMDICFIPDNDYAGYILRNVGENTISEGNFVTKNNEILGKHNGIIHYTIGQRKGLNLAMGHPVFVTEIRPQTNEVVIGENEDVLSTECTVKNINLMAMKELTAPIQAIVKIRYAHRGSMATLIPESPDTIRCVFEEPVRAITPGQSAVFYANDHVIGGGIIE